eukprot:scaffold1946_cov188-Ochromonas_danica.AAC.7
MAVLRYIMGEYHLARVCAEELCRIDPDNPQVKNLFIAVRYKHEKSLEAEREEQQKRDVGIAVGVGMGLAALGMGIAFALARPNKK